MHSCFLLLCHCQLSWHQEAQFTPCGGSMGGWPIHWGVGGGEDKIDLCMNMHRCWIVRICCILAHVLYSALSDGMTELVMAANFWACIHTLCITHVQHK